MGGREDMAEFMPACSIGRGLNTVVGQGVQNQSQLDLPRLTLSDILLPARSHLLKVPQDPDQHASWGT